MMEEEMKVIRFGCGKYGVIVGMGNYSFLDMQLTDIDITWDTDRQINKYCKTRFKWWAKWRMAKRLKWKVLTWEKV